MPVAGAIASVAGGALSAKGAQSAGEASAQGGRDAINAQLAVYNQNRADTLPFQATGVGALNMLAGLYGLPTYEGGTAGQAGGIQVTGGETTRKKRNWFDKITDPANLASKGGGTSYDPLGFFSSGTSTSPLQFSTSGGPGGVSGGAMLAGSGSPDFSAFLNSPDYVVARDEGLRGLDRSLAATGGLTPGTAGDADRIKFASNLGTQQFGNFTNNLFRLAGFGSAGNQQLNAAGQNFGNTASNALTNIGNARASSYLNQANAWTDALAGAGAGINQWGQSTGRWGG